MKISGIDPKLLPPEEVLVLPRAKGEIVIRARGLSDMDTFYKLCPEPIAPMILTKDGSKPDLEDKGYAELLSEHVKRRWAYITVASLVDVEWDTVQLDNPSTWTNWEPDLKANGFTGAECNRVFGLCLAANALDERKLARAREAFLAGRLKETAKA